MGRERRKLAALFLSAAMAVSLPGTGASATETEEEASDGTSASSSAETITIAAQEAAVDTRSGGTTLTHPVPFVVCLDPGHGGPDPGAKFSDDETEGELNLKISQYCRDELCTYRDVRVIMTREDNVRHVTLEERVQLAADSGADLFVCQHLNAINRATRGAEVYIPNSNYRPDFFQDGGVLARNIQSELVALGIQDNGIKIRNGTGQYPDGTTEDYYFVIRNCKLNGILSVLVEHCYIDNADDYYAFLNTDEKLQALGVADATGIAETYGLEKWTRSSIDAYAASQADVLPDSTYILASGAERSSVLDLSGSDALTSTESTSASQTWTVTHDGTGYLTLTSCEGTVLTVRNGAAATGTEVLTEAGNGSYSQKWIAVRTENGSVALASALNPNLVLSTAGTDGTDVQVCWSDGSSTGTWIPVDCAERGGRVLSEGVYEVSSASDSTFRLGLAGGSSGQDAVCLCPADETASQKWVVTYDSLGYAVLTSGKTGEVLGVPGSEASDGEQAQLCTADGSCARKWIIVRNSDGTVTLRSALNPYYVLTSAGEAADGTGVQIGAADGSELQNWTFREYVSDLPLFYDVLDAERYYYTPVYWARGEGVAYGVTETLFRPALPCSRAEFVTFLWRFAGSPEAGTDSGFADVPEDAYYAEAAAWGASQGIVFGTGDDSFSPDDTVTRAQAVAFLWRYSGSPEEDGASPFRDVSADAYYARAVAWGALEGIVSGTSADTFSPGSSCTRGQAVTFLYRLSQAASD